MVSSVYDQSVSDAAPVELFTFLVGSAEPIRLTTHVEDVTVGASIYSASPVYRGGFSTGQPGDAQQIEVKFPNESQLAAVVRARQAPGSVRLEVRRGHVGDDDYPLIFSGRDSMVKRDGSSLVMTFTQASAHALRPGLNRAYQVGCPFAVYDERPYSCGLALADWLVSATVSAATGMEVTLPAGWNGATGLSLFRGGVFRFTGPLGLDYRRIVRVKSDNRTLVLSGGPVGVSAGDGVAVARGCLGTIEHCEQFGNTQNYGGQLGLPSENPVARNTFF